MRIRKYLPFAATSHWSCDGSYGMAGEATSVNIREASTGLPGGSEWALG